METSLVSHAAQMAFGSSSHCDTASIHHSDRGSQYASESFRLLLQSEQITQSMSRKGNCYDNAMMESFGLHSRPSASTTSARPSLKLVTKLRA